MNLLMFWYVGRKPLQGVLLNRLEMVNEFFVCIVTFHMCFFTDWVMDSTVQVMYGQSMVITIVIHMLF